jgi:hypothetical protein
LMRDGPESLNAKEKLRLLWDPDTVFWLHHELWSRPTKALHVSWRKLQKRASDTPLLKNYLLSDGTASREPRETTAAEANS